MTDNAYRANAIRLLANGFADRFSDFCQGDERMHELMMDLAAEFVGNELPIVRDEDECDVAMELLHSVTIRPIV